MGVCNCSMFCCTLMFVQSSIAIILMGKRELVDLLNVSSWCLVMVEWRFLAVPWGCLRFVIVVFPDHNHLLFLSFLYPATLKSVGYYVTPVHSKDCVRVSVHPSVRLFVRMSVCPSVRLYVRPSGQRFHSLLGAFFNKFSSNLL